MMIDAITGFFSGYVAEKMMQKNIKPYQISLFLVVLANFLSFAYQLFVLGDSLTMSDVYLALAIFVPVYFLLWLLIAYFYKKEQKNIVNSDD